MAIIQRLRHFGDPPGPPASLGQPGQMAISIPSTGLAQLYIANNAGSWESFLDMWRNQPMGLAGLEASGKLLAAVIPQATEGAMGGAMIATQAEVNGELEDTKIVTAAKMAAYIAAQGVVVVPATETIEGIARYATQTEVDAGVLTTTTVRPSTLKPLADRVTTAEGDITELFGRMVDAETALTSLDGRLDTAETNIAANTASIATNTADITALDARLDTAETNITALQAKTNTATTAVEGIARLATQAEVNAGTAGALIVTPETLAARLTGFTMPDATEVVKGIAEIATTAEVTTGTDDARIITPLKLAQRIAAIPAVPTATETVAGIAEIATQSEVNAGADDARIITPAKLKTFSGIIGGQVTIGGGAASASIQSKSTAGSVEFQWDNGTRVYKAWLTAGSSIWTLRDQTAGVDRIKLDSSGNIAVGPNASAASGALLTVTNPAGYTQLSVVAGGTDQQARVDIVNSTRYWTIFSQANALHFYDITGGRERGSVDLNGVWKLSGAGTPANYAFLNVYGDQGCQINVETTGAFVAGVMFKNGTANVWTLQNGGDGAFRLYRGGTQIIGADSSSDVYFANSGYFVGAVAAPGGLIGGEGSAGRLKCYNTANYVTFQWTGTQLLARIDNGGAVVALN